jgi:ElaB/YqjD/DUF883 family membrane-anchored ribosome-binding protein
MSLLSKAMTARTEVEKDARHLSATVHNLTRKAARESEQGLGTLQKKMGQLAKDANIDQRRKQVANGSREAGRFIGNHRMGTVLVAAGAIALVAYLLTRSSKGDAAQTSEE